MELKGGGGGPPPGQQTKMSGTISPRDRLQLWVNTFLLKQKENSGSVTATFRDKRGNDPLRDSLTHTLSSEAPQFWERRL